MIRTNCSSTMLLYLVLLASLAALAVTSDTARADTARADTARADTARAVTIDTARADTARAVTIDTARADTARADTARAVTIDTARADSHNLTLAGQCSNVLPGAKVLLLGVDLSTLDIYDMMTFKQQIIASTCFEEREEVMNKVTYDLPDQVKEWLKINTGHFSKDTRVIETMSDVTNKLSVAVTVSAGYGPVSGSASTKYDEMQRDIAENKFYYTVVEQDITTGRMHLQFGNHMNMDESIKTRLLSLEPFDEAPEPYYDFIKSFGTHYFSQAYFGGVIRAEFKTSSSLTKKHTKKDLAVAASLTYDGLTSQGSSEVEVTDSQEAAQSAFATSSTNTIKYYGGDTNMAKTGVQEWQPSVKDNPHIRAGRLEPISDLIIGDPTKKADLEKAVDSYYKNIFMENIKERIRGLTDPLWSKFERELESGDYDASSLEEIEAKFEEISQFVAACYYDSPENYVGTRSVTATGRECQRWDSQTPHTHDWGSISDDFKQDERLPFNYCRSSVDGPEPWCYTEDPSHRWEECGISACHGRGSQAGEAAREECPTYTAILHTDQNNSPDDGGTNHNVYLLMNEDNWTYTRSTGRLYVWNTIWRNYMGPEAWDRHTPPTGESNWKFLFTIISSYQSQWPENARMRTGQVTRHPMGQMCLDQDGYRWRGGVPEQIILQKSGLNDGMRVNKVVIEIEYPDGSTAEHDYPCPANKRLRCWVQDNKNKNMTYYRTKPNCPARRFEEAAIDARSLRCE